MNKYPEKNFIIKKFNTNTAKQHFTFSQSGATEIYGVSTTLCKLHSSDFSSFPKICGVFLPKFLTYRGKSFQFQNIKSKSMINKWFLHIHNHDEKIFLQINGKVFQSLASQRRNIQINLPMHQWLLRLQCKIRIEHVVIAKMSKTGLVQISEPKTLRFVFTVAISLIEFDLICAVSDLRRRLRSIYGGKKIYLPPS